MVTCAAVSGVCVHQLRFDEVDGSLAWRAGLPENYAGADWPALLPHNLRENDLSQSLFSASPIIPGHIKADRDTPNSMRVPKLIPWMVHATRACQCSSRQNLYVARRAPIRAKMAT